MNFGFKSFDWNLTPNVQKIQEVSEDSRHSDNRTAQLNSLLKIVRLKFSAKPSSVCEIIRLQLEQLFAIFTNNQEDPFFEQKLVQLMYETFHQKFITNYHKFLISKPVLDLSYESKIFLLNVYRLYDSVLNEQNMTKKSCFNQTYLSKRPPWRQAESLIDPVEIQQYQMKMFMIYKGQFLHVLRNISGDKDKKKESKRALAHSDQDSQTKKSSSQCGCKKKKRKPNNLLSLQIDQLPKLRIEVKDIKLIFNLEESVNKVDE